MHIVTLKISPPLSFPTVAVVVVPPSGLHTAHDGVQREQAAVPEGLRAHHQPRHRRVCAGEAEQQHPSQEDEVRAEQHSETLLKLALRQQLHSPRKGNVYTSFSLSVPCGCTGRRAVVRSRLGSSSSRCAPASPALSSGPRLNLGAGSRCPHLHPRTTPRQSLSWTTSREVCESQQRTETTQPSPIMFTHQVQTLKHERLNLMFLSV